MEELEIQVDLVIDKMTDLEIKMDDFTRYGRTATHDERLS